MAEHHIAVWCYPSTPSYPDSPTKWALSCCDENEANYDTALDALDAVRAHLTKERLAELSPSIDERIERIEVIMRFKGMHEPTCAYVTSTICVVPGCLVYHVPKACNCWLADADS